MLDPSSSEEESDEIVEEESGKEVLGSAASGARLSPSRTSEGSGGGAGLGGGGGAGAGAGIGAGGGGSGASSGGGAGGLQPSSRAGGGRPSSPSPSVVSEKEKEELERLQKEEEERKKRLQLYVFVMRCIAYPFNAKQPTDMARRQQKVGAPARPSSGAGKWPGGRAAGRGEQWELAAQRAGRSRGWRPRPGEGAVRPPFRGRDPGGAWSAAPRSGPPRERGMRAWRVLLGGPGGAGSDLQPAAPTEAWFARGLPALPGGGRRLSAPGPPSWACARPAGAPGRWGRPSGASRAPLCSAWLSEAESHRRAGGRKPGRKAKLPVSPGRAPSSLPRVSRSRLGSPKGRGAPLPGVPSDPPSSSSLTPKQGTPCGPSARVRPSAFLPMALFSSQGDFAATFWLSEALDASAKSLAIMSLRSFLCLGQGCGGCGGCGPPLM